MQLTSAALHKTAAALAADPCVLRTNDMSNERLTGAAPDEAGLRRAALFGAVTGALASAAWFLPRLNSVGIDIKTLDGGLHVAMLLMIPAGTAALFAIVLGGMWLRFGGAPVAAVLTLFNVVSPTYTAWRQHLSLNANDWAQAAAWGGSMIIFAAVAARCLVARSDV